MLEQFELSPSYETAEISVERIREQFEKIVSDIDQTPGDLQEELKRTTPTAKKCGHHDAPGVGLGHN